MSGAEQLSGIEREALRLAGVKVTPSGDRQRIAARLNEVAQDALDHLEKLERADPPVPGLAEVFARIPARWPRLMIAGFLRTAQPELAVRGQPATPVDFLRAGGSPEKVLDLVEAIEIGI